MTGCKACSLAVRSRFSKACRYVRASFECKMDSVSMYFTLPSPKVLLQWKFLVDLQVTLRKLRIVSMPGSEVPSWLADEVRYTVRENYELKSVLVGVVVSINENFNESLRDHIPALPNIRATILTPYGSLFSTALPLTGVPKLDEDQVHFCRFLDFHPLVSMLRDGYRIRVENVPMVPGIQLKRSGIYLLYESDDDYDEDEESLRESNQTVSERLARFLNSLGAVN